MPAPEGSAQASSEPLSVTWRGHAVLHLPQLRQPGAQRRPHGRVQHPSQGLLEMRLRLRLRAARRLLPGAQRRLLRLRPAGAGDRRRPRQLRADRAHRRGRDRPPGAGGARACSGATAGDGGEAADTNGDGSPTRSRPRWSGACARSASGSRSMPRATCPAEAVADVFPAYDDDGGLLIVLTPES